MGGRTARGLRLEGGQRPLELPPTPRRPRALRACARGSRQGFDRGGRPPQEAIMPDVRSRTRGARTTGARCLLLPRCEVSDPRPTASPSVRRPLSPVQIEPWSRARTASGALISQNELSNAATVIAACSTMTSSASSRDGTRSRRHSPRTAHPRHAAGAATCASSLNARCSPVGEASDRALDCEDVEI